MNTAQQLDTMSAKNHAGFLLGLRILLGVILIIKGYMFMFRLNELNDVVQALDLGAFNVTLALVVAIAQLACGILIMIGLMTRLSCLVLFPILIGAVFYVNMRQGFITSSEWMLSVMILYLLIFFFVHGAGELSVYSVLSKQSGNVQAN